MDQDRGPSTPQSGFQGSSRVGSVWGNNEARKSYETARSKSPDLVTPVNKGSRPLDQKSKRSEAARFIKDLTKADVAVSSDKHFREALRDGQVLCQVLNKVYPGSVSKVHELTSSEPCSAEELELARENLMSFISGLQSLEVPSDVQFSIADIESEGYEERPRVVDCILYLRDLHCSHKRTPIVSWPSGSLGSDVVPTRDSPSKLRGGGDVSPFGHDLQQRLQFAQPHQQQVMTTTTTTTTSSRMFAHGVPSAGIAALLQACAVTLNSKSGGVGSSTSGQLVPSTGMGQVTIDSSNLTPVLEQILGSLTREYETRLLAKDHELNDYREKMTSLTLKLNVLQTQIDSIKGELAEKQQQAVDLATAQSSNQLQQLRARSQQLEEQLREKEALCAHLQAELEGQEGRVSGRAAELAEQLEAAQQRLAALEDVQTRYAAIKEENRSLYNQVQDLKGSIRVFCRVRPAGTTGSDSRSCTVVAPEGDELAIYDPAKPGEQGKKFKFDRVFEGATTQEQVYEDTQPLVRSVMDGFNVCIFAYGQTGSGKTHTMTGTHVDDEAGRGINYRALDDLFRLKHDRAGEVTYDIKAQMLEIYNETVRDLLSDDQGRDNKLNINNTQPSGRNVPGATQLDVSTTRDVLTMMKRGARNRHSAETKMNQRSSRSHQVLTIIVDSSNHVTGATTHACLHLVDLAGSERVDKSGAQDERDRMREAQHINTSLSALGDVMTALADKAKRHVPFRNSILTQLLQDSLCGQAKVMMFMHIAPEGSSYSESNGTLNFGSRVSAITLGQAKRNGESGKVFEAREEVQRMQAELEAARADVERWHTRAVELDRQLKQQAEQQQRQRALLHCSSESLGPIKEHTPVSHSYTPQPQPPQPESSGTSDYHTPLTAKGGRTPQSTAPMVTPQSTLASKTPRGPVSRTPVAEQMPPPAQTPRGSTVGAMPTPRGMSAINQHKERIARSQAMKPSVVPPLAAAAAAAASRATMASSKPTTTVQSARNNGVYNGSGAGSNAGELTDRGALTSRGAGSGMFRPGGPGPGAFQAPGPVGRGSTAQPLTAGGRAAGAQWKGR